jgi:hypothetical protein
MRIFSLTAFACVFFLATAAIADERPKIATYVQSAETAYKISQLSAQGSDFAAIDGVMTDRSEATCSGFKVVQKIVMRMYPAQGGPPLIMRMGSELDEAKDGLSSKIRHVLAVNDKKMFDYTVTATFPEKGKPGVATRSDQKDSIVIPVGTLFLGSYMHQLVAAAGEGKSTFESLVFDGDFTSGDNGVKLMAATIGAPRPVADPQAKIAMPEGTLAWPIELASYDPKEAGGAPLMQNGFSLLPNGMAEAILMDMQTAKLRLDLDQVKLLPKPECN